MQQFYTILDYANERFAVNGVYTPIEEIKDKGFRDPDRQKDAGSNGNVVFIVIAAIVIVMAVVAIIGCVIVRIKNQRLQANLAKYEQL